MKWLLGFPVLGDRPNMRLTSGHSFAAYEELRGWICFSMS